MSDPFATQPSGLDQTVEAETVCSPATDPGHSDTGARVSDHPSLELGGVVGRGGMSEVREAFDHGLRRSVAAKLLHQHLRGSDRMLDRFLREAEITASLEHPHIIPVHALVHREDVGHFFTMKMAAGHSLADLLALRDDVLEGETLDEVVDILIKVCDALSLAHAQGFVHLDVKPSNILLGEHGEVYLTDWGIARRFPGPPPRTARGGPAVSGTPSMLAPEQARCGPVDGRTDVFGVGAALYAVVAGQGPFRHATLEACIEHAARCRHPDLVAVEPRTPEALARVVARAMAPRAADRYPRIQDLRRDLDRYRRGQLSAPERTLEAGEFLLQQGASGDMLFFVVDGEFEVLREVNGTEEVINVLGPGAVIGELGVLSNAVRTASVRARTSARVQVVTADRIRFELGRMPTWMRRVVESMSDRVRRLQGANG